MPLVSMPNIPEPNPLNQQSDIGGTVSHGAIVTVLD